MTIPFRRCATSLKGSLEIPRSTALSRLERTVSQLQREASPCPRLSKRTVQVHRGWGERRVMETVYCAKERDGGERVAGGGLFKRGTRSSHYLYHSRKSRGIAIYQRNDRHSGTWTIGNPSFMGPVSNFGVRSESQRINDSQRTTGRRCPGWCLRNQSQGPIPRVSTERSTLEMFIAMKTREISTDDKHVTMTVETSEQKVDRSVDNRFAPAF